MCHNSNNETVYGVLALQENYTFRFYCIFISDKLLFDRAPVLKSHPFIKTGFFFTEKIASFMPIANFAHLDGVAEPTRKKLLLRQNITNKWLLPSIQQFR